MLVVPPGHDHQPWLAETAAHENRIPDAERLPDRLMELPVVDPDSGENNSAEFDATETTTSSVTASSLMLASLAVQRRKNRSRIREEVRQICAESNLPKSSKGRSRKVA